VEGLLQVGDASSMAVAQAMRDHLGGE
jgi:hypothetical protein